MPQPTMVDVSIVVPVYNELANLPTLLRRIAAAMSSAPWRYEVLLVDDRSTDGSSEYLAQLAATTTLPFPFRALTKKGRQGKAFSLLEGFAEAKGGILVMIDADLQYAPEEIPAMLEKLNDPDMDIVVANRSRQYTSASRRILTRTFRWSVGKLLNLKVDIQSGLKVFRAETINTLHLKPTAWGFDYQFLYLAHRRGWQLCSHDIVFAQRVAGTSSVNTVVNGAELLFGAIALRASFLIKDVLTFLDYPHPSERHPTNYSNQRDFLYLPEIYSIKKHIYSENVSGAIVGFALLAAGILALSMLLHLSVPIIISGLIALLYLGLFIFKVAVVRLSLNRPGIVFSKEEIAALKDEELPIFSIIIPLYKEASVIRQIGDAMSSIDYPKDKLDAIITLEEYDKETIDAINEIGLPSFIRTLILPDVKPKTKPKALNVAFPHLKGEFLVIYDAEIVPEPTQLKKAVLAFRKHADIACLQIKLDHFNARETWVTKLFNAEFSFYYDLFLPGLQQLGVPLPLSGHSSLYRVDVIREIGAWDPYNVTEDAELGMRLYRKGYKTDMLESYSLEEATSTASAWVGQRTRWIKGFIQTTLVHLRHPLRFKQELGGWGKFFGFLIVVPGSVLVNILNLFYWVLLAAWFLTHSPIIQSYFPGPILYISVFSFLAGNFLFTYLNLIGSYRRGRYDMVKYSLLSPIYWLMLAWATLKASVEIIYKPHHWSKTVHGVHLAKPTHVTLP
jgi:cellulose synthase/poly-beta-1,6-N-acetylglucosamine synthase-like glycosyltransferase